MVSIIQSFSFIHGISNVTEAASFAAGATEATGAAEFAERGHNLFPVALVASAAPVA